MRPLLSWVFRAFDLHLLRGAALIVPMRERAEWAREWQSELWHVRQDRAPTGATSFHGECEVTSFCLGAFQDAVCLRQHAWHGRSPLADLRGSATMTILILAVSLAAFYAVSLLSPGVRAEHSLSQDRVYPGLVLIQDSRHGDASPTISPAGFLALKAATQKYLDGFAFYRITREPITAASSARTAWGVARASPNLFVLLNLPVRFASPTVVTQGDLPKLILSDSTWKRDFQGDRHIAGRVVRVGLRNARIAGVAPQGSWRLPGKVDAWLLEPDAAVASDSVGYVVAHLTASGQSELWAPRVQITVYNPDDSEDDLLGVSLDHWTSTPSSVFLFAVLMAFFALPATTSVSLGEYSFGSHRPSWSRRLHRWGFLSAKIALLLPIVYFASLDLIYSFVTIYSPSSAIIHFASSFSLSLFGLRWALLDQRHRCPVCLRQVAHPAQVGYSSRTFLAWNGTELICMAGHTLLHIPQLPTSWFNTQRWLYLDTSWDFLFTVPEPGAGTSE
jgi:hypothetical protein